MDTFEGTLRSGQYKRWMNEEDTTDLPKTRRWRRRKLNDHTDGDSTHSNTDVVELIPHFDASSADEDFPVPTSNTTPSNTGDGRLGSDEDDDHDCCMTLQPPELIEQYNDHSTDEDNFERREESSDDIHNCDSQELEGEDILQAEEVCLCNSQ